MTFPKQLGDFPPFLLVVSKTLLLKNASELFQRSLEFSVQFSTQGIFFVFSLANLNSIFTFSFKA